MSASFATRRWISVARPATHGLELLGDGTSPIALRSTLDAARESLHMNDAAFVLVRVASMDHLGIQAAFDVAARHSAVAHVTLAIDHWTLARIDPGLIDTGRVGLVLDDIDIDTPSSAMVHSAIEAVRFRRSFVTDATHRARVGCALEAMLGLARNLGVATMGPVGAQRSSIQGVEFDYVQSELVDDDPSISPVGLREHEAQAIQQDRRPGR